MDILETFIAVDAVYTLRRQLTQLLQTPYNAHGFDGVAPSKLSVSYHYRFLPLPLTDFASLASGPPQSRSTAGVLEDDVYHRKYRLTRRRPSAMEDEV
jgi:hypothetical protein